MARVVVAVVSHADEAVEDPVETRAFGEGVRYGAGKANEDERSSMSGGGGVVVASKKATVSRSRQSYTRQPLEIAARWYTRKWKRVRK